MCTTCGCGLSDAPSHTHVTIMQDLLAENDARAAHNRAHLERHGVVAVNLMSSPGSGKTALLEATLEALREEFAMGVVVGDLETDNDARRLRAHGVQAVQITTGQACHLDAAMVHRGLHELALAELDLLFVENVGNLVCPASFDLGQHHNVALLSVTEGDDKPAKYPVMFRGADLIVINKADLLPYLDDFDPRAATDAVRALANDAPVLTLSARRGEGIEGWLDWVRARATDVRRSAHP